MPRPFLNFQLFCRSFKLYHDNVKNNLKCVLNDSVFRKKWLDMLIEFVFFKNTFNMEWSAYTKPKEVGDVPFMANVKTIDKCASRNMHLCKSVKVVLRTRLSFKAAWLQAWQFQCFSRVLYVVKVLLELIWSGKLKWLYRYNLNSHLNCFRKIKRVICIVLGALE